MFRMFRYIGRKGNATVSAGTQCGKGRKKRKRRVVRAARLRVLEGSEGRLPGDGARPCFFLARIGRAGNRRDDDEAQSPAEPRYSELNSI